MPVLHPWRSIRRRIRLRQARRKADLELIEFRSVPPRLAWRAEELTGQKRRKMLARSIRRLVASAETKYLPGASVVNRVAIRAERLRLLGLAARLEALDRPVTARGVLLVEDLLTCVDGPIYVREDRDALPLTVDAAYAVLEAV